MEVNEELLLKAIKQAIASVEMEMDIIKNVEDIEIEKQKKLILKGKNYGRMGRLCYWRY